MPALPAIPGLLKLLLYYSLPGIPRIINRLFFNGASSPSNTDLNTWSTNVANRWGVNMKSQFIPTFQLNGVIAEDLTSSNAGAGAWAGQIFGTNGNTLGAPASSCMLISNPVQHRTRGGHSRNYLAGLPSNAVSANPDQWTSAAVTAMSAAWNQFIKDITSPQYLPTSISTPAQQVAHYYKGNNAYIDTQPPHRAHNKPILDPGGPAAYPVLGNFVEQNIASQRRRNER